MVARYGMTNRRLQPRVVTVLIVLALATPTAVILPHRAGAASAPAAKTGKLSPRLDALSGSAGSASPRAHALPLSLPASGVGSLVRHQDGRVLVEIRTADTSAAGVAALRSSGAHVVNVSPAYATVTATVAPGALRAIADNADVRYVSEVLAPRVGRAAAVAHAAGTVTAATACAPVVSEGDSLMNVGAARTNNSVDGAGQTIGILSDSFNTDTSAATHASDDVAAGDLPGAANPCGHTTPVVVQADYSGGGQADEGRAMAQLAHDLAPGAHLAFATAANGPLDFASQINTLRTVNHASAIVDDISYLDEPFFQDGPIANAANAASAAGVPYFSAAGNSNVVVGGHNVSSYEAPLLRSGAQCPAAIGAIEPTVGCHDFDTTVGIDRDDDITLASGGGFVLDLQWAQPLGGVSSDYDVFVLNASGAVVGGSNDDNLASQEPFEALGYQNTTASPQTVHIVIAKFAGPNVRTKFVLLGAAGITAVQYNASTGGDIVGPSIFGHNGASTVASTAAVPYDNADTSEDYSSRGPVTLYFQPSPSDIALIAPQVLAQPAFAATDNVQTSFLAEQVGGVWRFAGTSAAAPQAAAIGALLQEYDPALTPAELIATLANTARPIAANGTADAVGGGYLDADAALASVIPLPGAPGNVTATSGSGEATVTWAPSVTNPNFPVTGYTITPILGGVPQPGQTFGPNPTERVVTGLANGSYTFTVAATNANGDGPASTPTSPLVVGSPPNTTPTMSAPLDGSTPGGDVTLSAASGAPLVQFYLDAAPFGTPVAVVSGSASSHWLTWGLANGVSHAWTAADCNEFGCSAVQSTVVTVSVANSAPAVTAPVNGATTGPSVTLRAVAPGGGVAFFVGGVRRGFDASAPYSSTVALGDGAHSTFVRECNIAGTVCNGPVSPSVSFTVKALHPQITSVSPNPFSPHRDGRADITAFRIYLPDTENVTFVVQNGNGQTVRGPYPLGSLGAGNHTYRWDGKNNARNIVGDGVYTIVVTTTRVSGSVTLHGKATATVRVDDTPPALSGVTGNGATFYPIADGYQDTFRPRVAVNEGGLLWLQVFNGAGVKVRSIGAGHASPGTFERVWNGRNDAGALVAQGRYRYRFVADDRAGNRRISANAYVSVSRKRLVNTSVTLSQHGDAGAINSSAWYCADYSYPLSEFVRGVWLLNVCDEYYDGFQSIWANYSFTVPGAIRYNSIRVQSYGNTIYAPEIIGSLIYNFSHAEWNGVGALTLTSNADAWSTYGTVAASGRVSGGRIVKVQVFVPNSYPPEDYDIGVVRITVSYAVLR
jgi:flagellar hook assembly protein FlgD